MISGVDLVPIKHIKNVTTFTSDITTETCRQVRIFWKTSQYFEFAKELAYLTYLNEIFRSESFSIPNPGEKMKLF